MNPQQPPQMPPNQQPVPDHRFGEMQERLRQLELQNTQLRTTVDFLKQPQGQQQAQPSAFKPEVEEAIRSLVNQRLAPVETQYRQQIGYLADQLDQAKFDLHYGGEKFKPYHEKVEQLRQIEIAKGNYVPREDLLRMVHFEETGKKSVTPAPAEPPAQQQPKFDPFFQTMVDPVTGMPLQPDPEQQFQQPQQPAPQYQQPVQQFQQPQQPPQPQHRPPVQSNHPYGNAYGQSFQLPGQGVNHPAATQSPQNQRAPLDLATATDSDLEAFERNFGEIPL